MFCLFHMLLIQHVNVLYMRCGWHSLYLLSYWVCSPINKNGEEQQQPEVSSRKWNLPHI